MHNNIMPNVIGVAIIKEINEKLFFSKILKIKSEIPTENKIENK